MSIFHKFSPENQVKKILLDEGWISSLFYIIHLLRSTVERKGKPGHIATISLWGRRVLNEKLDLIQRKHQKINSVYFRTVTNDYYNFLRNEREEAYLCIFGDIDSHN